MCSIWGWQCRERTRAEIPVSLSPSGKRTDDFLLNNQESINGVLREVHFRIRRSPHLLLQCDVPCVIHVRINLFILR